MNGSHSDAHSTDRARPAGLGRRGLTALLLGFALAGASAANSADFSGIRVSELFLQCEGGLGTRPFVELVATRAGATFESDLAMQIYDRNGALVLEHPSVLDGHTGDWALGSTYLIATGPDDVGGAPDRALGLPLDTLGGTIRLVHYSLSGPLVLQNMRYGTPTIPRPTPGTSLQRQSNGSYAVAQDPDPRLNDGSQFLLGPCLGQCAGDSCVCFGIGCGGGGCDTCPSPCPPSFVRLGTFAPWDTFHVAIQSRTDGVHSAAFDLTRAELSIVSPDGASVGILANDDFRIVGLPPATPVSLTAEWSGEGQAGWYCNNIKSCDGTRAFLTLVRPGVDSAGAILYQPGPVSCALPLDVFAGAAFRLRVEASVGATIPSPPPGGLHGQLHFVGLPPGARVVSCWGYDSEAPTAAELTLAEATIGDGTARLRWFAAGERPRVTVERRAEHADWAPLGTLDTDGSGYYEWTDPDLQPGDRFAWRLTWSEAGTMRTTSETWLDVPGSLAFALRGLRPNPTPGASTIAFALDRAGDVRAELIDVAGRRVLERRWTLDAGEHALPLVRADELRPGVYLVRLSHAGRSLTTRAVIGR